MKHSDERPAPAASQLRWPRRRHTGCFQTTHEGKSWLRPPSTASNDNAGDLPAELAHRAPIDPPFSCPWEDSSNWSVHADNLAHPGSQDDTTPYKSFIRHLNALFIIYTDGWATAVALNGGAGDPANPMTLNSAEQLLISSHHLTQPWPSALTATRFLQRSNAAPPTLQTSGACLTNEQERPPYSGS